MSAAYLQSPIEDEVFVERPPSDVPDQRAYRKKVWRLKKAVHGLSKSPRYWFNTVNDAMIEFGLTQSQTDPCVFTGKDIIVGVWVDDFIYGGTPEAREKFEKFLTKKFVCDTPEDASCFCGIDVGQTDAVVTISQDSYIERLMSQYGICPRKVDSPIQTYLEPAEVCVQVCARTTVPAMSWGTLLGRVSRLLYTTYPGSANRTMRLIMLRRYGLYSTYIDMQASVSRLNGRANLCLKRILTRTGLGARSRPVAALYFTATRRYHGAVNSNVLFRRHRVEARYMH